MFSYFHPWLITPACAGRDSGDLATPLAGPSCSLLVSADWIPPQPWPRATLASLAGHIKMSSVGFPQNARDALAPRGWLAFSREEGTQGYQRSPWDISPPPESIFPSFFLGRGHLTLRWAFSSFPAFPEICPWDRRALCLANPSSPSPSPHSVLPSHCHLGFSWLGQLSGFGQAPQRMPLESIPWTQFMGGGTERWQEMNWLRMQLPEGAEAAGT